MTQVSKGKNLIVGSLITVVGTVQGVGFRPFVWHLAKKWGVKGEVGNDGNGVYIIAWASNDVLLNFLNEIQHCNLDLAIVDQVEHKHIDSLEVPADFQIAASRGGDTKTGVPSEAATCSECLADIKSESNRRHAYPFTNCTHCGPRFTIIKSLPYDRANTSMSEFKFCQTCRQEYENPSERRFHAQANACAECGPHVWLTSTDGREVSASNCVNASAEFITQGQIVAIKGLGGFQLLCDAGNDEAVTKLRMRKQRFKKALAMMARDLEMIRRYCRVNDKEAQLLQSPAAPIVILEAHENHDLASAVAPGQHTLAFMLPYTPLHHLLLNNLDRPVVCSSGNLSEEPQCTDNIEAAERLSSIADFILFHNREIVNRVDDSVSRLMGGSVRLLRRARGYTPAPISLPKGFGLSEGILALGGELKNTFCLVKNGKAVLSQHIGDLEDARTFAAYRQNIKLYESLCQVESKHLVVDLHPEYLSSKLGKKLADEGEGSLHMVQHHHAHIAACMAENCWALDAGPVLGIALDGLGYGLDQGLWGGEFLLTNYSDFSRLASFKPVPLLGGKQAMKEPWRNTYAHIVAGMGWKHYKERFADLELTAFLEAKPLDIFNSMLSSRINVPLSSSCGRLFDAVAAAIGVCRQEAFYEGQAAVELESLAAGAAKVDPDDRSFYHFQIEPSGVHGIPIIEPVTMWRELFEDLSRACSPALISARFHRGLAQTVVDLSIRLCARNSVNRLNTVALSGGVFQNKLFLEEVIRLFRDKSSLQVLTPKLVPANDGGLSFGQAAVCAARLIQGIQ